MLQQTRVETVVPYYRLFLERWPTLEALAAASDEEVLAAFSGLGYYARCRNLLAAAREAVRRHGGLPSSVEALRALPGLGRYTAGAVASIAYARRVAAVDGNVARVLTRLFRVEGEQKSRAVQERLWGIARSLVGEGEPSGPALAGPKNPGDFNQALMELGAMVCKARPECARCPLQPLCASRAAGLERDLPRPGRKAPRRVLVLACAVVELDGSLLLFRQPKEGLFGGLLVPPFLELSSGKRAGPALRRSLEARGVRILAGARLGEVSRTLTHRVLRLRAYACALDVGACAAGKEGVWVEQGELERAGLPTAFRALLAEVRSERAARSFARGKGGAEDARIPRAVVVGRAPRF